MMDGDVGDWLRETRIGIVDVARRELLDSKRGPRPREIDPQARVDQRGHQSRQACARSAAFPRSASRPAS